MEISRDFKGVWIPREIYLSKELSLVQKVLLVEIDSLDCSDQHCWASNDHFAEFLGISVSSVKRHIKHLKDLGLIDAIIKESEKGTERILISNISHQLNLNHHHQLTLSHPPAQSELTPSSKWSTSNTINNTINNTNKNIRQISSDKEKNTKEIQSTNNTIHMHEDIISKYNQMNKLCEEKGNEISEEVTKELIDEADRFWGNHSVDEVSQTCMIHDEDGIIRVENGYSEKQTDQSQKTSGCQTAKAALTTVQENLEKKKEKSIVKETKEEKERKELKLTENFEKIYAMYKVMKKYSGKQRAFRLYKAWLKGRNIDGHARRLTHNEMGRALQLYIKQKKIDGTPVNYWKNIDTFFNVDIVDYVDNYEEIARSLKNNGKGEDYWDN